MLNGWRAFISGFDELFGVIVKIGHFALHFNAMLQLLDIHIFKQRSAAMIQPPSCPALVFQLTAMPIIVGGGHCHFCVSAG